MGYQTRKFRPEELQLCTREHHAWKCTGCGTNLLLQRGDTRLGSGQSPRCGRCGDWMCPVNPDTPPASTN